MRSKLPKPNAENYCQAPAGQLGNEHCLTSRFLVLSVLLLALNLVRFAPAQVPLANGELLPLPPPLPFSGQANVRSDAPVVDSIETPISNEARASQLMINALLQAVWGEGRRCHVKQRIALFDREMVGFGQYAHAGGGTGKLKMSLRFAAGDQLNSFSQVSDGKLLHTTNIMGDKVERRRVDIGKVHEFVPISKAYFEDPVITMYLAIGGQGEILRKLCQQYRWFDVQVDRIGDDDVWLLKGEAAKEPVRVRAFAPIDSLLDHKSKTGLLPTYVRVALGRAAPNQLWLFRVEQWKANPMAAVGDSSPLNAVIEFVQPEIDKNLPPRMFEDASFASSSDPITDETDKYVPPPPTTAGRAPLEIKR